MPEDMHGRGPGAADGQLVAEEMKRRLRLLQASLSEAKGRAVENLWMSRQHVGALLNGIEELAKAAAAKFSDAEGEREAAQRAIIGAERAWSFLGMLSSQHQDAALGPWLQIADYCVIDAYETLRAGCVDAGLELPLPPPPLTFAEAIASPVVYQREAKVRAPGLGAGGLLELPLPVVVYPPHQLQCLWLYSTLYHELGHNFDRTLGLAEEVDAAIGVGLGVSGSERSEDFRTWRREMLADAIGVGLGGEGFAYTLAQVLESLSLLSGWPELSAHPPPIVRLVLVAAMLETIAARASGTNDAIAATVAELRRLAETSLAKLADPKPFRSYLEDAPVVARSLLESPLKALGGKSLVHVLPDPHQDSVASRAFAAVLQKDEASALEVMRALIPAPTWRLLPAAAQLAVRTLPSVTGAALDQLQAVADACRSSMPAPSWVVPPVRWRTLAELIPQLDRSIYEEERSGYKRPPVDLLRAYDVAVFVGATHDQLEEKVRIAFETRKHQRWTKIELFFLDDAELGAIAAGQGAEPATLRETKAKVLEVFRELLPDVAKDWAIYTYARPYYFASYWSHEERGGRIHVSPFIWGQPVKNCPGLDYSWHKDRAEPTREYRAYRDGLGGLRNAPNTKLLFKSPAVPTP